MSSQAARALSNPDAADASEDTTVGYRNVPSGGPVAKTLTNSDTANTLSGAGVMNGTAFLAFTGAFEMLSDSATDSEKLKADGEPFDPVERPIDVTEALAANVLLPEVMMIAPKAFTAQARPAAAGWDASEIVTEIYKAHYNQLVRLAVMLVHDVQTGEEVVQDSFEAMHLAWRRLRSTEKALAYLRQTIVNKSRSVLRHRKVVEMHTPKPVPDEQSAEHAALTLIERSSVTSALRALPERQREAIVLRYYGDFSEADIAKAMGISKGAVKSHTARAMAALKVILKESL